MAVMNLAQAAKMFNEMADAYADDTNKTLQKALDIIKDESQRVIGTYDPLYEWPQLAPETQRERERLGFSPNDPLLRTGELRDSIETEILQRATRDQPVAIGEVGTNDPVAAYQEFGTATIPARSFLERAAVVKLPEIADMAGDRALTIWRTGRPAL
jgi:hypothetical protein